ncbi:MAG: metal ABC transporter permease [Patescibacteria group bacterium]|nr:metal ABC transporter permease [Patescibacteria group bacterium]
MNTQLLLSLISGICISGVAGYLGTLMLSKKMSVIAGPLAHLALPGAAIAIIFGLSLFVGVFPFVLLGTILIWALERKTRLPMENLTAIMFAFGVGTALLILPIDKADAALIGSINTISPIETAVVILISLSVIYMTNKMYSKMMLTNIHEDLARSSGINIDLYNFLYLLNIGLVVSMGVYLVGGLITAALIAIPAAIAKNISSDLKSYKIWATISGAGATIIGIFLNYFYNFPTGPLIVVTGACLFLITVSFKILKHE